MAKRCTASAIEEPVSSMQPTIKVAIDLREIPQANLDACARVFARICVERAMVALGLDRGPTNDNSAETNHIERGPAGVGRTDEAEERVK